MESNGQCRFDKTLNRYVVDGKPLLRVSHVLELAGLGDDYSRIPMGIRQAALDKGATIHDATECIDAGRFHFEEWDELIHPQCRAWQKFRQYEPFKIEATEQVLWTFRNGGCAGTADRIGTWDGRPCIIDIKTGKRVYWSTRYQLALYVIAWNEQPVADGSIRVRGLPFRAVQRRVVHLKDDGTYDCKTVYDDPLDCDTALAALTIAHVRLANGVKVP